MQKNKYRAIELFAGIGGFRLALDAATIQTIWANDCKEEAAAVYQDRFGSQDFMVGDIHQLIDQIPQHDILTAGFPCQPFSSAGKKQGLRDPRGSLFEIILQVLRSHRPRFFVLENVKRLLTMERGLHFATILNALTAEGYFIEWRLLNALHFGLPQNRQRIFIVGTLNQPKPDQRYLATQGDLQALLEQDNYGLIHHPAQWTPITQPWPKFANWGVAQGGAYYSRCLEDFSEGCRLSALSDILQTSVDLRFDYTESTLERIQNSEYVNRFVDGVQILYNQRGGARMGYTVFGTEGIAPTLTATTSRHYERYYINGRYRRLTNVEYARLQGFSDEHCRVASVYDQYALYGNAVPPPMVKWVIESLLSPFQINPTESRHQLSLFQEEYA